MDTSKGRRGVGYGRFRGVRKTLETETSSPIETKAPLLETKKNETRFSPQSQGKQLTPYATMILSTTFVMNVVNYLSNHWPFTNDFAILPLLFPHHRFIKIGF